MDTASNIEAVAIGASAGGVEALGILLETLPAGFALPLLIVVHVPADQTNLLPKLFSRRCAIRLKEVEDKEAIAGGTAYFAAPDYHMLVEPGRQLALSRDEPVHYSRPSIDLLFESAACVYRDRLLGIILTGASIDGSAGLKAVRVAGGQAWVQDPGQAKSSLMPASALATAGADLVLPVEDIAARLASFGRAGVEHHQEL